MQKKLGKELRVGDVISTRGGHAGDVIIRISSYKGKLLNKVCTFNAHTNKLRSGLPIINDDYYDVIVGENEVNLYNKIDFDKPLITVYGRAQYVCYNKNCTNFPHIVRLHDNSLHEYNNYGECFGAGTVNVFNAVFSETENIQEDQWDESVRGAKMSNSTGKVIYKYQMPIKEHFTMKLPKGAEIIRMADQNGMFWLWAVVDTREPDEEREFYAVKCGANVPEENNLVYRGFCAIFVQMELGLYIFEKV